MHRYHLGQRGPGDGLWVEGLDAEGDFPFCPIGDRPEGGAILEGPGAWTRCLLQMHLLTPPSPPLEQTRGRRRPAATHQLKLISEMFLKSS